MSHSASHMQHAEASISSRPKSSAFPPPEQGVKNRLPRTGSGHDREGEKLTRKEKNTSSSSRNVIALRQTRGDPASVSENPKSPWGILLPKFLSPSAPPPPSSPPPPSNPLSRVGSIETQSRKLLEGAVGLEGYFQQPAQNSSIQKSVSSLRQDITAHVYNYYGDLETPPSNADFWSVLESEDEILRQGKGFLDRESFRLAAIEFSIARSVLQKISLEGDPDTTFLPRDIVSLLGMVPDHSSEKCE